MLRPNILVPTDLSMLSMSVLPLARRLGQTTAISVIVPGDPALSEKEENRRRAGAFRALTAELRGHRAREVVPRIAIGDPAERIASLAKRSDIDLIVMTSHGRTGLRRALLGSVAERTLQLTARPMLICRGATGAESLNKARPVRALVAVDPTEGGRGLIHAAIPWLRRLGAVVDIVAVVPASDLRAIRVARRELDECLLEIPGEMRGQVKILKGTARTVLNEVANRSHLLVIGHHLRRGVDRLKHGSLTHAVMRRAHATLAIGAYSDA